MCRSLSIWHQLNFLQLFKLPSYYCCCFCCHSFNQYHRHYQHHNKFHQTFCWIILCLKYHEWWSLINLLCNTVGKSSKPLLMLLSTMLTHWNRVTHTVICVIIVACSAPSHYLNQWQLLSCKQRSVKFETKYNDVLSKKCLRKCRPRNDGHSVQTSFSEGSISICFCPLSSHTALQQYRQWVH